MIEDNDLKERNLLWDVMEEVVTFAVIVGIFASMCFMFGFLWYAP